jgi:hypothetical protein
VDYEASELSLSSAGREVRVRPRPAVSKVVGPKGWRAFVVGLRATVTGRLESFSQ